MACIAEQEQHVRTATFACHAAIAKYFVPTLQGPLTSPTKTQRLHD
jgi:hypothetical protein